MKPFAVAGVIAVALAACAANAQARSGDVRYTCGGVGSDERRMLETTRADARLELMFVTAKRGGYVAGARVTVSRGNERLASFESEGPICLLDLPAGSYRIEAKVGETASTRTVNVPASGRAPRAVFMFPDEPGNDIPASEEEKRQAREP